MEEGEGGGGVRQPIAWRGSITVDREGSIKCLDATVVVHVLWSFHDVSTAVAVVNAAAVVVVAAVAAVAAVVAVAGGRVWNRRRKEK